MKILYRFVFGLLLGILMGKALAQHECQGGHNCNEDGVIVSPINGSDKSYVFGFGGTDMEIRDCLATYSFLFGIWQNVKMDPLCEALRLQSEGNYQAAAEMRCSTRKYRKVYGKFQACVKAVIYEPPNNPEPNSEPALSNEQTEYVAKEEYEDRIAALEELFDKQEADSQRQQQVQRQQYRKMQRAEEARQQKIDLIREEFGEQTTTASD